MSIVDPGAPDGQPDLDPVEIYLTLSGLPALDCDDTLVEALTYEVMNYSADLADRDPGEQAWADLEETVRDCLQFLSRAAKTAADELACPECGGDNWRLAGACSYCGAQSKVDLLPPDVHYVSDSGEMRGSRNEDEVTCETCREILAERGDA